MGIYMLIEQTMKELPTVIIKSIKTVDKYYHRIFKL